MSTTKTTITEEELKELKKKSVEILSGARRALLLKYPFIGSLLMRMNLVPVRDMRVRTACTDGDSVYFDIDFLSRLSTEEQIFVLGHELYHGVLLHLTRLQSRDPELFNIATDKEVNNLLKQDGLTPPCNLLFPEGEECGKSAEEIYEILLKKMKKQAKKQAQQQQGGTGSKIPQAGSSGNDGDENDSDDNSQGNSQANGKKKKKNQKKSNNGSNEGEEEQQDPDSQNTSGNKDGELSGQFDRHQYRGQEDTAHDGQQGNQQQNGNGASSNGGEDGEDDQQGNQNGGGGSPVRDKWGDVGFDKDYKPSISKDFSDKMREAVIATAQQIERQQGSLPAHIAQIVKGLMKPEIKWQELLAQFVTKCFGTDRHWLPPNRRHVYKKMYLPSRRSEKIKGTVIFDTSGSCQGDLKKFLSELVGLINSFGDYELNIIMADCEVDNYEKFDSNENPIEVGDENNFSWIFGGGGGTSFKPAFDYILDNQIDTDFIIYMTDGFGDCYDAAPIDVPTLWIITKGGTTDFCNWGEKIPFESDYDQSYDWD